MVRPVVLDTNVLVAAGFRPASASGRIVAAVKNGELQMVWSDATRREIERIVHRIPQLGHALLQGVFLPANRYADALDPERFTAVSDPEDRKFAALAAASDAVLVTNDEHLLAATGGATFDAQQPAAFWRDVRR